MFGNFSLYKREVEELIDSINSSNFFYATVFETVDPDYKTFTIYNRELMECAEENGDSVSTAIFCQSSIKVIWL